MLTLMLKDLRVVAGFGWLIVWLVVPSYLVPAMAAARTGSVFLWVNVAFAAAAIVSVCLLDARSGAGRFIHSLPVTRTEAVRARYGTSLVLATLVLGVGACAAAIAGFAAVSAGGGWPRWAAPDVALAYVLVMAVVISIYLPCYFRWGYGAGTVVAAILLAGLVIAGDAAGGLTAPGVAQASHAAGLPRGVVVRAVAGFAATRGIAAAMLAVGAAAMALLAASAALATRAYRHRQF